MLQNKDHSLATNETIKYFRFFRSGCASRSGRPRCPAIIPLLLLCEVFLFISEAPAQTIKGSYSFNRDEFYVNQLLAYLSTDKLVEALKYFFNNGKLYDEELADLLMFIDNVKGRTTHITLMKNSKPLKNLYGQKYIYVMIFLADDQDSAERISNRIGEEEVTDKITKTYESQKDDKTVRESTTIIKQREPLSVHQSSLDYRPGAGEFFVSTMVRTIASIFAGKSIEKGEEIKKAEDIPDKPIKLQKVGRSNKTNLYFGYLKVPIYENTINRITVQEDYGSDKVYRHLATFGNYSASRITTSIGAVSTFIKTGETLDNRLPVDVFAFGHFYIRRPRLPAPHFDHWNLGRRLNTLSFSLVAGTKLSDHLFDDIFFGASVGHLISTTGLLVGINYRTPRDASGKPTGENRKAHFCLGLTFIF